MRRKILSLLFAVAVVVGGVATLSAFEAHVVNVTAHIENALGITAEAIEFGTVFPQESLESDPFIVSMSDSFLLASGINEVDYMITQKPKLLPTITGGVVETTLASASSVGDTSITVASSANMAVDQDIAIGYPTPSIMERNIIAGINGNTISLATPLVKSHVAGETVAVVYKDLCKFLSKIPETVPDMNDVGVPSYFNPGPPATCSVPVPDIATGVLDKTTNDTSDGWTIDLKVPPITGFVGQDWPDSCNASDYVVAQNDQDYGCDLWIEITAIK